MKISTKGIYALEVAVDLAIYANENHLESIKSVAERRGLSEKYLERIVGMLKRNGIVKSTRGAFGGYCLARNSEDISVLEVLRAAEGDLAPVDCLTKEAECGMDCSACATQSTWNEIWEILKDTIKDTSIGEIRKLAIGNEGES